MFKKAVSFAFCMTETTETGNQEDKHRAYVKGLPEAESILIELREELYKGNWNGMTQDLTDRLDKKPYLTKLVTMIERDLAVIKKLEAYEVEHGVNLADFVE